MLWQIIPDGHGSDRMAVTGPALLRTLHAGLVAVVQHVLLVCPAAGT
jgi:hypothetical protein